MRGPPFDSRAAFEWLRWPSKGFFIVRVNSRVNSNESTRSIIKLEATRTHESTRSYTHTNAVDSPSESTHESTHEVVGPVCVVLNSSILYCNRTRTFADAKSHALGRSRSVMRTRTSLIGCAMVLARGGEGDGASGGDTAAGHLPLGARLRVVLAARAMAATGRWLATCLDCLD